MKILIFGEEAGMFENLCKWFNDAGHESIQWRKFLNVNEETKSLHQGSKDHCSPCPMSEPDIILVAKNYLTWEDLDAMGIKRAPRVYYNLGNSQMGSLWSDKRMKIFNDYYISYNPSHAFNVDEDKPDRFANLKFLPLPIDFNQSTKFDYSGVELKVHQCQSDLAMMGPYDKQPDVISAACKQAGIPYRLHFGLDRNTYMNVKKDYPVYFDNYGGIPGKATWEALASGQCVLTKFNSYNLSKYEELFGVKLPILSVASAEELAQALSGLKSGTTDWKSICVASSQFMSEHYSPSRIAELYLTYFKTILGESK
jgi:hypothetical protein